MRGSAREYSWLKRLAAGWRQRYPAASSGSPTPGPWAIPDPGREGNWAGATCGTAAVLVRCSMEELPRAPLAVYQVLAEGWMTHAIDPARSDLSGEVEVGELVLRCGGPRKWNQWPARGRVPDEDDVEVAAQDGSVRRQFDRRLVAWALSPAFPKDRCEVRLFAQTADVRNGLFVAGPNWVAMIMGLMSDRTDAPVVLGPPRRMEFQ